MSGIVIQNLRFSYPGSTFALNIPDLRITPEKPLAILGPSGGGKTTLLRLICGLLTPESGGVEFDGTSIHDLPEAARREMRLQKLGLIFQDFALLDYLTVEENILLPSRFHRLTKDAAVHGRSLAERLDLSPHWKKRAGKLSQGERQRVAIARALVHRPQYLFADEPTASLDATRRSQAMDMLLSYAKESDACLVTVTHDPEVVSLFPSQIRVEDFAA